jgi:hypothetical protein
MSPAHVYAALPGLALEGREGDCEGASRGDPRPLAEDWALPTWHKF